MNYNITYNEVLNIFGACNQLSRDIFTLPKVNTKCKNDLILFESKNFKYLRNLVKTISIFSNNHKGNIYIDVTSLDTLRHPNDLIMCIKFKGSFSDQKDMLLRMIEHSLINKVVNDAYNVKYQRYFLILNINDFVNFINNIILINSIPHHEDLYKD